MNNTQKSHFLVFALCLVPAIILFLALPGSAQSTIELQPPPPTPELGASAGLDPALVSQMLAAGVGPEHINPQTAAEWLAHQEKRLRYEQAPPGSHPSSQGELPSPESIISPEIIRAITPEELLWQEIEAAYNQDDTQRVRELAERLPVAERDILLHQLEPVAPASPQMPMAPWIGINGAACAYENFAAAMAAASSGNTLYIAQGTHMVRIGTIEKNLAFSAANATCTASASSGVTIDANDAAATWGGVADIDYGIDVTFTNLILTDGSATFGGIVYAFDGSHVLLDNTDLTYGTAISKGGGFRLTDGAVVEMINGSEIVENVTTGSGDGGGVAILNSRLILRDDSRIGDVGQPNTSADQGGGVYMENGLLQMYDTSRIRSNDAAAEGGGICATSSADIEMYDTSSVGYIYPTADNDAEYGGGIYLYGSGTTLKMYEDSAVRYNDATTQGGGIFATHGANVLIDSASVIDNETVSFGGGIFIGGGAQATIQNNSAINFNEITGPALSSCGGGIYVYEPGTVMTVTASSVMSNTSSGYYGGIGVNGNAILRLLSGANLSYNDANGGDGGGLGLELGSVNLDNAVIQHNTAADDGGGITQYGGEMIATDPDIRWNSAADKGGGIYRTAGNLSINASGKDSYLAVNWTTSGDGGGIYDSSGNSLNIWSLGDHWLLFNTNTAGGNGGGIYATDGTHVDIWGKVQMTSNFAVTNGGAIYIDNSRLTLDDFSVSGNPQLWVNDADNGGGIYLWNGSDADLEGAWIGSTTFGNEALVNGGGIYADLSWVTMTNTLVRNNSAGDDGGGLWTNTAHVFIDANYETPSLLSAAAPLHAEIGGDTCNINAQPADRFCSEFRYNDAGDLGGAMHLSDLTRATIEHTAFISNTARTAAAIDAFHSDVDLRNSLVSYNDADTNEYIVRVIGDGVDPASLDAFNNTFADNKDRMFFYSATEAFRPFNNNIVWGNNALGTFLPESAECNDIQAPGYAGNISSDPLFITTARGKYHLRSDSPAIDQCATGYGPDLDGWPRPIGSDYDMGAFEWYYSQYLPLIRR